MDTQLQPPPRDGAKKRCLEVDARQCESKGMISIVLHQLTTDMHTRIKQLTHAARLCQHSQECLSWRPAESAYHDPDFAFSQLSPQILDNTICIR